MISSRFAICAAAAAVALSLSACSTVDLDKDKAGSITDGTSVEEALSSKTGPLANREVHFDYGKEKPKAEGHDEAAYYENRRVDIHYMLNK